MRADSIKGPDLKNEKNLHTVLISLNFLVLIWIKILPHHRSLRFFSNIFNLAASASNIVYVFIKFWLLKAQDIFPRYIYWWKRNGQPYHTDDYIFNKNVKAVWGCPHITSPLSRGRGDHKLMIHNQTKLMTWGRVGEGQKLCIKSWWSNIWMAPMCLLSGIYVRFMSFGQGLECRNWYWMSNICNCYLF